MHKRRAALYEPLVGGMQVQCYMSYLRKMTYELGEVWNEIGVPLGHCLGCMFGLQPREAKHLRGQIPTSILTNLKNLI